MTSKLINLVQQNHFEEAIKDVNKNLNKLTRTQFKANSLTENQFNYIEQVLKTLQDFLARREVHEKEFFEEIRQEKELVYEEARAEFAIGLLPVLDGLEAALKSGEGFLQIEKPHLDLELPREDIDALMPALPKAPATEKNRGTIWASW